MKVGTNNDYNTASLDAPALDDDDDLFICMLNPENRLTLLLLEADRYCGAA